MMTDNENRSDMDVSSGGSRKQPTFWVTFAFILLSVGVVLVTGTYVWRQSRPATDTDVTADPAVSGQPSETANGSDASVLRFGSEEEFKQWLSDAESDASYGDYGLGMTAKRMVSPMAEVATDMDMLAPEDASTQAGTDGQAERYSETNVQVVGLDEPDIVKTDGREIFYSPERRYYFREPTLMVEDNFAERKLIAPAPDYRFPGIKAVRAFPPSELKLEAEIDRQGQMLLFEDTLVVLADDGLYAYDVSQPASPQEKWNWEQEDNAYLVTARLMAGKIYLVTSSNIDRNRPCPMPLFVDGERKISVACGEIWHPAYPYPSDVTFAISVIDAKTGETAGTTAFVGSSQASTIYMSPESIYLATAREGDSLAFFHGFILANSDFVPDWVSQKVAKVIGYDLSSAAKTVELEQIMSGWIGSLSPDERLLTENEMQNRLEIHYEKNLRNWESTSLVRINLTDLAVKANGSVPGRVLNQFSLDEKDGNLRIAVTVGGRQSGTWRFGLNGNDDSVSDVYVLGPDLKERGSAKDMGKGERIYSVRFLGNRGYVVTFKETDPFYVLDLTSPDSPSIMGELKIPGYSSYLHPLGDDRVIGIGKDGSQVKISLFGVGDPSNPTELAKYTLKEYWSDVLNNHHAFLLDSRHEVFFLPGGLGGYVFSYKGDTLSLARAIGDLQAKRAIYIDDYMYIIGDDKLVVLNETDWQEVNRLKMDDIDDLIR